MRQYVLSPLLCLLLVSFSVADDGNVNFETQVRPILESACLNCHNEDLADGDLRLDTSAAMLTGGSEGPAVVPGKPEESLLYTLAILPAADELAMPPDVPLTKLQTEVLRKWISQGASWPEGPPLQVRERKVGPKVTLDDLRLVQKIRAFILETEAKEQAVQEEYQATIPKTGAKYSMVPLPGGKFLMGSPAEEPNREEIEGPQQEVTVDPFWIGKYEVTWDEYEPYMITEADREKHGGRRDYDPTQDPIVDGVSQPTPPYTEMSFGMGQRGFPAISMTQHAASKYCQWLSAQTGHFYRLPTEAEWEYACRAGTNTAYSFGDDEMDDYAWYYDNADEKYQEVGMKKPNPFGLHDMHGNVMEWCIDQFVPDYFSSIGTGAVNPLIEPSTRYPRTVRGGGWDDDPEQLRSAFRRGSDKSWKQQDPQLPKSLWYHTNAPWLGFRIVRPAKVPSAEEMFFYWNSATDAK